MNALSDSRERDAPRSEVTVYPDTVAALEAALEACRLVSDGDTVEAGDRDRFVKARANLRVLKRELEGGRDGK